MPVGAMQPYVTPCSTRPTAIYIGLYHSGIVTSHRRGTKTTDIDLIGTLDEEELTDQLASS